MSCSKAPRPIDIAATRAGGIKKERPGLGGDRFEGIGVAPMLGAAHIVGNRLAQELGFGSSLHREAIPIQVQLRQIDEARRGEFHAPEFLFGGASAGMIPGADNEEMARPPS